MNTQVHPEIYTPQVAPEYLKLASAASLADCSVDTIRRWIRNGQLAGYRNSQNSNSAIFVRRDELINLLAPIGTK